MIYISDAQVNSFLAGNMPKVVDIMRRMFEAIGKEDGNGNKQYIMGGKNGAAHGAGICYSTEGGDLRKFMAMPGWIGGEFNVAGIKWYGPNAIVPGNDAEFYFTVILNNAENGRPFVMMSGDTLTRYRTAAVNALAAETLCVEAPEILSIVGPGRINRLTLDYLLRRFPTVKIVKVKGRGCISRDNFIKDFQLEFPEIAFVPCDKLKEVVLDADIVLINAAQYFESYSDMPIIRPSWVKKGCTFVCSSYVNFPDSMLCESLKICDLFAMYENFEEELGYPAYRVNGTQGNRWADMVIEKKIQREDIIDFSEIASGQKSVDRLRDIPVIFTSGGIVLEDIALAKEIYCEAKKNGIGMEVE